MRKGVIHHPSGRPTSTMLRCDHHARYAFRLLVRLIGERAPPRRLCDHHLGCVCPSCSVGTDADDLPGFLRSLSLHVQVCWKVVPGAKFFWASIVTGLVVPAVIVGVAIPVIGLSYRIGETCLMSHEKALASYWIPLLSVAAMSALLQCVTFAYCVKVYVKSLFDDTTTSDVSSGFRSYSSSMRTVTAKQALRRIKTVVALQYRSICIVLITLADVVFLSVIFISMDSSVHAARVDVAKAEPWLLCLVVNNGDKTKCFHETRQLVRPEASVMAAYILLSVRRPHSSSQSR